MQLPVGGLDQPRALYRLNSVIDLSLLLRGLPLSHELFLVLFCLHRGGGGGCLWARGPFFPMTMTVNLACVSLSSQTLAVLARVTGWPWSGGNRVYQRPLCSGCGWVIASFQPQSISLRGTGLCMQFGSYAHMLQESHWGQQEAEAMFKANYTVISCSYLSYVFNTQNIIKWYEWS